MSNDTRDRATGRFSFQGGWERMCKCGHTLGTHTADPPHVCNEDGDCGCGKFQFSKEEVKAMQRADFKKWYMRNQKKKQEQTDLWLKNNRARARENAHKRRQLEDPNVHKARSAVSNAIKTGKLVKEPCRDCEAVKVDFHHSEGYEQDKWLTGVWLCRRCHAKVHREIREASTQ